MKISFDYHTHTKFSHGKGTILQNAISAKQKGLLGIAISDHGFSHPAFGTKRSQLKIMKTLCNQAENQTGIAVKLSVESNLRGESGKTDVIESDYNFLDCFLVGAHKFIFFDKLKDYFNFFGKNFITSTFHKQPSPELIKLTTRAYVNAVKNYPIDAITHINYLYYSDPVEVAKVCADYGTALEISTKKVHLSDDEWFKVAQTKVNFLINSDAHSVDRIGDCELANQLLTRVDIPKDRILNIDGKVPTLRFEQFKATR